VGAGSGVAGGSTEVVRAVTVAVNAGIGSIGSATGVRSSVSSGTMSAGGVGAGGGVGASGAVGGGGAVVARSNGVLDLVCYVLDCLHFGCDVCVVFGYEEE
jgi:hypothetical protein